MMWEPPHRCFQVLRHWITRREPLCDVTKGTINDPKSFCQNRRPFLYVKSNLFDNIWKKSHLFILPAAWQRVLPQVHLGAIFVVDLCVQVVLLPASAQANYFLLAVAARICFGLFSVLKAQRGSPEVKSHFVFNCPWKQTLPLKRFGPALRVDRGAHLVMLR